MLIAKTIEIIVDHGESFRFSDTWNSLISSTPWKLKYSSRDDIILVLSLSIKADFRHRLYECFAAMWIHWIIARWSGASMMPIHVVHPRWCGIFRILRLASEREVSDGTRRLAGRRSSLWRITVENTSTHQHAPYTFLSVNLSLEG